MASDLNSRHVCIVTHGDGSNPTIRRMVRVIAASADRVTFYYWDRLRRPELLEAVENVTTRALLAGGGRRNLKVAALLPWFWLKVFASLMAARPTMVYAHAFEGALPAWLLYRIQGVPYFYHIHDNITMSHRWSRWMGTLLGWIDSRLAKDAATIVLPDACRIPRCDGISDKILILPNSTDVIFDLPAISADPAKPLTIAAVGSLETGRGLGLLIQATEGRRNVQVVAAGYVPEKQLLAKIARQKNWHYAGVLPHPEVRKLYAEADLVFLFYAPDLEINRLAVPIKLPEALASGRPVLINQEVALSSRVCDWGVGYTCAYDAAELRDRLGEIAINRPGLLRKSESARDVYAREFAWAKHAPRVGKALDNVLEGATNGRS